MTKHQRQAAPDRASLYDDITNKIIDELEAGRLPDELTTQAPSPAPGLIEPRVDALIKATGIDFHIGGLFRVDQLAPHRTSRTRPCYRTHIAGRARSLGLIRHQEIRLRGAGRRD